MAIRINRSRVGKTLGLLHRDRSFLKSADGLSFLYHSQTVQKKSFVATRARGGLRSRPLRCEKSTHEL
jgi:hypothetical protein